MCVRLDIRVRVWSRGSQAAAGQCTAAFCVEGLQSVVYGMGGFQDPAIRQVSMEFAAARNVVERNRGDSLNGLGKCFAGKAREVLARCAAADPVRDRGIKKGNFHFLPVSPEACLFRAKAGGTKAVLIFDVGTFGGAGTDFNFHVVSSHAGCRRSMAASNCFASGFNVLLISLDFSLIKTAS